MKHRSWKGMCLLQAHSLNDKEEHLTSPLICVKMLLCNKSDAGRKAKEAFVLELLRHGDISAGRAAKPLDISRWDLSDLMSEVGISPFAELTAEELDAEVETALNILDKP